MTTPRRQVNRSRRTVPQRATDNLVDSPNHPYQMGSRRWTPATQEHRYLASSASAKAVECCWSSAPPTLVLAPLPGGAIVHRRRTGDPYDIVLLFVTERHALEARFVQLSGRIVARWCRVGVLAEAGQRGGHGSDRRTLFASMGCWLDFVDVKVAAIDATWSGLKFVRRLADRAAVSSR